MSREERDPLRPKSHPDASRRHPEPEFLASLGVSQVAFAAHVGVPVQRINEILRGKRGITPQIAWLFSQVLNTMPELWINLQTAYDLDRSRPLEPVQRLAAVNAAVQLTKSDA